MTVEFLPNVEVMAGGDSLALFIEMNRERRVLRFMRARAVTAQHALGRFKAFNDWTDGFHAGFSLLKTRAAYCAAALQIPHLSCAGFQMTAERSRACTEGYATRGAVAYRD